MSNLHLSFTSNLPTFPGIYSITNIETGNKYIGSSNKIKNRRREHARSLLNDSHHCRRLQAAWNFHGPDAFIFEILEGFRSVSTVDLLYIEQEYIDATLDSYNTTKVAGRPIGYKKTPEQIEKTASKLRGVPLKPWYRLKRSLSNKGKKRTKEQCANIRAATIASYERRGGRGHLQTAETIAKISASNKGRCKGRTRKSELISTALTYGNLSEKHITKLLPWKRVCPVIQKGTI